MLVVLRTHPQHVIWAGELSAPPAVGDHVKLLPSGDSPRNKQPRYIVVQRRWFFLADNVGGTSCEVELGER